MFSVSYFHLVVSYEFVLWYDFMSLILNVTKLITIDLFFYVILFMPTLLLTSAQNVTRFNIYVLQFTFNFVAHI